MSPRRKFQPGEPTLLVECPPPSPRPLGLPVGAAVAALLTIVAITLCTLMLISFERGERVAAKDRQVLNYVNGFMKELTSVDPFHANAYVERILGQATGDFAKQYREKANEILFQVAQAEPATGTVLESGVERWNDDGSATVIVATAVTTRSADEKQVIENANRWMATAAQEGNQWKISSLQQVI